MTNSNYTHLLTIVDRSGSMYPVQEDMRGALNEFFKSQAEAEGKCLVDYVQFDGTVEYVYRDKPVAEATAILEPRGSTALLDAIGLAVTDLGKRFAEMSEDERPGTVVVAVVTDGYENSSREWTAETIKALIEQQEDQYNWDFTFLGANMDAVAVGGAYGFKAEKSLTYNTAFAGATAQSLSAHVHRTRSGDKTGYTSEERLASVGNHSHGS